MDGEQDDLRRLVAVNNATNAFQCTGLFPFNPFSKAWTDAIETIGQGQKPYAGTQYEIFPNDNVEQLSESESTVLRQGLDASNLNLHDAAVAYICAMQILSRWREDILNGVSKGEKHETYSNTLLPSPKTEPKILAMRLVHFQKIDRNHLSPATIEKTKEEKAAEITRQIVYSTKISEPIAVTYFSLDSESDDVAAASDDVAATSDDVAAASDDVATASDNVAAASDNVAATSDDDVADASDDVAAASDNVAAASADDVAAASDNVATASADDVAAESDTISKSSGTALKIESNKWQVRLTNKMMIVMDEDLMDANKFYVRQKWMSVNDNHDDTNKRKQCAKRKRARKAEQFEREKRIRGTGLEKLRELEFQEYNRIRERFESGDGYKFEEFVDMIDRMRKPFVCQVEGHEVSLTQDNCAIMMETSAVRAITDSLFLAREKQNKQDDKNTQQNK